MEKLYKLFCIKCCCCCYNDESISENKLCDEPTKEKKNKNNSLFSCFQIQEDEFDIIDSNEIKSSKFEKMLNISNSIGTQTETNNSVKNINNDEKNDEKNNEKNEFENDFIITDSDLEKN